MKQLAQIERREARLRRINAKKPSSQRFRRLHGSRAISKRKRISPEDHHFIGISENFHEHLGTFLRLRSGDLAIQVRLDIDLKKVARAYTLPGFLPKAKATHTASHSAWHGEI